jgi:hypothetical protein
MPLYAVGLIHAKKKFCMQCDNAIQKSKARNKNAIIQILHRYCITIEKQNNAKLLLYYKEKGLFLSAIIAANQWVQFWAVPLSHLGYSIQ